MSLLDAYEEGTLQTAKAMDAAPLPKPVPEPKHSAWTVLPRALAGAALEVAGNLVDVGSMIGQVAEGETRDYGDFEPLNTRPEASRPHYEMAREMRPDPLTAGLAENVIFGVGKGLTKAGAAVAAGGPILGAAAFGLSEGMTTSEDLAEQGVDAATRQKVGTVTGVVSGASVILPVAGTSLLKTAGLVAAGGPAAYIAQETIIKDILEDADYQKIADQHDPLDPVGLAVSTLLPAAFGAMAMRGAFKGKATQEELDAAMVHNTTIKADQFEAETPQAVEAMKQAEDSVKDIRATYEHAGDIGKVITENLMDIGVPPQEAADKGLLWDSFFKSMSDKTGQDAQQLFGKYFDRVFSSEQAQGDVLMQQQEYKGTPNTEYVPDANFISEAKAHFGVTRDPREAGYILPDGTMLDFTGRHYSSDHPSLRGQRAVDHRELTGENSQGHSLDDLFSQDSGSGNNYMHEFMARTGAMRVDFNAKVASTMRAPTPEQLLVLGQNLKGDWSAVSYIDPVNGRIVGDSEFERTTPATISKFFAEHAGKDAPPNAALFQSATPQPTFYSQLSRAVADAPEKVFGSAAQFKQWLTSNAGKMGVKKDEIEWTGINDWLDAQGKNKVSKADIAAYLEQGGVKVEEVMLGKASGPEWSRQADEIAMRDYGRAYGELPFDEQASVERDIEIDNTKFSTYQLPGGENYRELLLTLPEKNAPTEATMRQFFADYKAEHPNASDTTLANEWAKERGKAQSQQFRSSHFDQPNILAHVRFNERTDAEGKRVLFLEEIQSDWAQRGRKEGFKQESKYRYEVFDSKTGDIVGGYDNEDAALRATQVRGDDGLYHLDYRRTGEDVGPGNKVPAAPFVQKTEAWTALALKRMIRYAAENGFDRIAWTNGDQQADRYSLAKQVSNINWSPLKNGRTHVGVNTNGGMVSFEVEDGRVVSERNAAAGELGIAGKGLDEVIGKAASEKILSSPEGRLEGDGLKIGGEGMRGFYDQIVPQVARDVMKKLGGGEVERISLSMYWIKSPDRPGGYWELYRGKQLKGEFGNKQEAEKARDPNDPDMQPAIILTDAMKAKAQEGMPLFQGNRGFLEFKGSKMGIGLLASADRSTFLHESGHFFLEVMNDLSKEAEPLRADIDALHQWMGVQGDTPEARSQAWDAMSLDEKRPMHEQFARGFEQYLMEGKAPNSRLAEAFARFRDWLIEIYKSATALNVQITDEVRAVMDRMLDSKAKAPQSPPGGDVPPPRVMAGEATAADLDKVLASGEPNLENHKPLSDPDVQGMLQDMALNEAGWAEKGGYLLRSGSEVAGEEVISRTKWIPKAEWWADRPAQGKRRLNEEQVKEAVRKAIAGEPLKPLEQSTVDFMAAIANDRIQGVEQVGPNGWDDAMQWVNRFNEPPTTENVFDYLAMERAIEINPEAANAAMDAYNIHNDDALVMAEFRSIINEKIQQDSQSVSGGAGEGGGEKPAGQPDPIEAEARRIADADPSRTISLGTDANGEPVKMTVAEYLDAAKMEADQARKDVSLIQAAAECLMGNL